MLHGQETELWADAGYVGVDKRQDMQAALIKNDQTHTLKLHVAKRRSTMTKMTEGWQKTMAQVYEKLKAQVRSKVKHPFRMIKNLFHDKKARYQGINKNDCQLNMLFALSNLYMVRAAVCPR